MELAGLKILIEPFKKGMKKRQEDLKKRRDTNAKCIAFVDKFIQDNFKTEGAKVTGGRWVELSELTLARRRKEGKGAKILQDTGRLKGTWKHLYTHDDARIQSEVDYAIYHNRGGKKLPKRQIVPEKEQVWPGIQKIYKLFLGKVLK